MSKVTAHMSMSVDGYVAGPNGGAGNPLGDAGSRIQDWMYNLAAFQEAQGGTGGSVDQDNEVLRERFEGTGAVVMGRRMFDEGEEPWGEEPPFHAPVFVLTHRAREPIERKGGTVFTFVTAGAESAVAQAKQAAGTSNVNVAGGAQMVRQAVESGLLDELQLHIVPLLFGNGVPLFEQRAGEPVALNTERVVATPRATHIRYTSEPVRV